jgi:U3 small nucleolar RNA-associated protein 25
MLKSCQENKTRFTKDYSLDKPDTISTSKPDDFIRHKFEGNDDDLFGIGLKFTQKSLKLFVDFYNADVILASPLSLKRVFKSRAKRKEPGDNPAKKKSKGKGDYDFLSSISLLIMDSFTHLHFQNWDHLVDILAHLILISRPSLLPRNVTFQESSHTFLTARESIIAQRCCLASS